ncbi:peptidoglycan recognition protein family protein [Colidextribacter sp. 210702-DFI.3.9]|nr:peptidoglycan recognition protein family protein [Colidextribacter sp. 210702-DFI.3.9]
MRLYTQLLVHNSCYIKGEHIKPRGVMVHSTGAANPYLRRYLSPDDGRLGEPSSRHWNQGGVGACVHAFIGRLADGSIAAYQTLPWTMRGWHCGGTGNDTHISFEICEDKLADKGYFRATYQAAVELTAYLCKRFSLDPLADGVVLCHSEGYKRGIASNHADVMHWWGRYGVSMDNFRRDVAEKMKGGERDLTEQEVRAIIREELAAAQAARDKLPASDWAAEKLKQAKAAGITDGTRPQSFATRQEVALMVQKRFYDVK